MKLVIELLLKWQTYLYMIQNMYLWFDTTYFVENNKIDLLNCKRFSFQAMTSWWKNRILWKDLKLRTKVLYHGN